MLTQFLYKANHIILTSALLILSQRTYVPQKETTEENLFGNKKRKKHKEEIMGKSEGYDLSKEILYKILDNIYHEVYVIDTDWNILYVNDACYRHYNLYKNDMIGRSHHDFDGTYWYPSILSSVHKEKRRMCIEQITCKGEKIISTAVPILDAKNEVKMIVSIVQENINNIDMGVNAQSGSEESIWVKRSVADDTSSFDIITRSQSIKNLLHLSRRVAQSDIPILIEGDSGTGKGMLARYIHEHSPRHMYPFLSINCAAIPENLLESELFGYAPYAFTGASSKGKTGLIEMAERGTLFLDEVAELTPSLQAKLLNIVEENQYMQVGGKEIKKSDVRIISATNQNLEKMIHENRFREDLFWRLNIVDLKIPSLIERKEDIIPLSSYYLHFFNKKYKMNKVLSEEVLAAFSRYSWPGNVRQMRNSIEQAFVLSEHAEITNTDLPTLLLQNAETKETSVATDLKSQMDALEKPFIVAMYNKYRTSRKMATALDISQSKANRLIQKYLPEE